MHYTCGNAPCSADGIEKKKTHEQMPVKCRLFHRRHAYISASTDTDMAELLFENRIISCKSNKYSRVICREKRGCGRNACACLKGRIWKKG